VRVGGHNKRVNEGEYGGCILYSYMKIEVDTGLMILSLCPGKRDN
jgi:hypothetical protein